MLNLYVVLVFDFCWFCQVCHYTFLKPFFLILPTRKGPKTRMPFAFKIPFCAPYPDSSYIIWNWRGGKRKLEKSTRRPGGGGGWYFPPYKVEIWSMFKVPNWKLTLRGHLCSHLSLVLQFVVWHLVLHKIVALVSRNPTNRVAADFPNPKLCVPHAKLTSLNYFCVWLLRKS